METPLRNPNHPPKGSSIKVEPIRDLRAIQAIKSLLQDNLRDLCLFTLGINTAYRATELLSLTVGRVAGLKAGDRLDLKQSKNGKYRGTTLNRTAIAALKAWLAVHPDPAPESWLFPSRKYQGPIGVPSLNHLVKKWCAEVGLKGNYGSHTLRKTWGYHQRVQKRRPVALLMAAYGHTSEAQTLDYLGIQSEEIADLYMDMEL